MARIDVKYINKTTKSGFGKLKRKEHPIYYKKILEGLLAVNKV